MSYKDYDQNTLSRDKYRRRKEVEQAELEIKWKQEFDANMNKFGLSDIGAGYLMGKKQVCLDINIHKNKITSELDQSLLKFMEINNLVLTRITASGTYAKHYNMFATMEQIDWEKNPGEFKLNSHPHLLLSSYVDLTMNSGYGYCVIKQTEEKTFNLDYKTYTGIHIYNGERTFSQNTKLIPQHNICFTTDLINEVIENFDHCLCLKYCSELEMKIKKVRENDRMDNIREISQKYRSLLDRNTLKNKIIESPIRRIILKDYGCALDEPLDDIKFTRLAIIQSGN